MASLLRALPDLQGFDGGTTGAGLLTGPSTAYAAAVTFDATTKRSGLASFKCATGAGNATATSFNVATALGNTMYIRAYFFWTTLPSGAFLMQAYDTTTNALAAIAVNSSAKPALLLWESGTQTAIATGATALVASTWNRLDLVVTVPTTGSTTVSGYLNDTQFGTGSGASGTNLAIGSIGLGIVFGSASQTVWVDDIGVNDSTTGGSQTGLLSDSSIIGLFPTADSSRTGFTNGTGGTTSLFDAENNTPPVGKAIGSVTATSQIIDATNNATDNYVATCATPPTGTVLVAQGFMSHASSTTTAHTTDGISVTANPVIAESTGTTGTTAGSTWPTGWTTLKTVPAYAPTISGAPTVKFRRSTGTGDAMAALMGLLIEYTPTTVVNGTCSMSATASQTVSGSTQIPGTASQSATLSQTVNGTTVIPGATSQSATLAQTAVGSTHIPGTASQAATLTETVSGTTVIPGAASQSATLTQTVSGTLTANGSCTMSATLAQTVSATVLIPGTCSMSATLGQTASGSAHIPATCSMGATLAQTATGSTHLPGTVTMSAVLSQTAAGSTHLPGSASMSATVTQTVGGSAHLPGSVSMAATVSQTVAGVVHVHGTVTMTAVLTQTVDGAPGPTIVWLPTSLHIDPVDAAASLGTNTGALTMGTSTPRATMGNPAAATVQYDPAATGEMSAGPKPAATMGNPKPTMNFAG